MSQPEERQGIAIVGMAGRFPGAPDLDRFWSNLRQGVESIRFFTAEELAAAGVEPSRLADPTYVRARPVLDGIELFDAAFFGFTPREAATTDPQHRLFLECAWEALEDAGHDPERFPGLAGVYAGSSANSYLLFHLLHDPGMAERSAAFQALTGNDKDYLTTRVSYKLDLRGPSLAVQTACSTSLVAVHLACESLLNGECDLALAGAVAVRVPQESGYDYLEGGIVSPDGHCRSFDAAAQGTLFGSGLGIVVLRRLDEALADGDRIRAVIRGSAVNNDGSRKVGYTAPGLDGQTRVIGEALAVAGFAPESVGYVEAHGTATPLGDPIELQALTAAFRAGTAARGFCALGSVKSNLGHLEAAAGMAGLIKTVLAMEHGEIPPTLHCVQPNPRLDLAESPFYIASSLTAWRRGPTPRRAGVSSFGIGGTNAHLALEEAPFPSPVPPPERAAQLLVLSARSGDALARAAERLRVHLEARPRLDLAGAAYTLQVGRRRCEHRLSLVCRNHQEAVAALAAASPAATLRAAPWRGAAMLFPGQGAHYAGMGAELYAAEPAFRAAIDRALAQLPPQLGSDLATVFNAPAEAAAHLLDSTRIAQPAIFAVEYALARLLEGWGIRAEALLGHSVGEYVAACLAGVFSPADALTLVAARGRLVAGTAPGAMLSVPLPEGELAPLLGPGLCLAAVNAQDRAVVAGEAAAIAELAVRLGDRGIACRRLATSHAFHSPGMAAAAVPFLEEVRRIALRPPERPLLSTVTGTWMRPEEATDPHYWVRHLLQPVRFADAVGELLSGSVGALIEVGPGRALGDLARRHPARRPEHRFVACLPGGADGAAAAAGEQQTVLEALGRLWQAGAAIDWRAFHGGRARPKVELPTYPFDRRRHWVEAPASAGGGKGMTAGPGGAGARLGDGGGLADPVAVPSGPAWRLFAPVWSEQPLVRPAAAAVAAWAGRSCLLVAGGCGLGAELAALLRERGARVAWIQEDGRLEAPAGDALEARTTLAADFTAVLDELGGGEPAAPLTVFHLGAVTAPGRPRSPAALAEVTDRCFHSPVALAQALARRDTAGSVALWMLASGLCDVLGSEPLCPEKALLHGPCRVIPYEQPEIACHALDLVLPDAAGAGGSDLRELARAVLEEAADPAAPPLAALRGRRRWVQSWQPLRLPDAAAATLLRPEGVYLITGGLSGVGLEIARHLASTCRARLALLSRTPPLGHQDAAEGANVTQELDLRLRRRRREAVRELERAGAEVLALAADVADPERLREAVDRTVARFGRLDGVIHAAGVAGGAVIARHSAAQAAAVLAPKLGGTLALEAALAGRAPDFVVYVSSTLGLTGGFGQVDYAAANACLDALARARTASGRGFTLAIDWDLWRGIGMARRRGMAPEAPEASEASEASEDSGGPAAQPPALTLTLTAGRDWQLSEHRVLGRPVLPGTAYLELVRAALAQQGERPAGTVLELSEVVLLSPLAVPEGDTVTLEVVLRQEAMGGWRWSVASREDEGDGEPLERAQGMAGWVTPTPRRRLDVAALFAALPAAAVAALPPVAGQADRAEGVDRAGGAVSWGQRWDSLRQAAARPGEAVARLELPARFAGELAEHPLHPALLDVATGFVNQVMGGGLYLPLSYRRLRLYGPLPARLVSHARSVDEAGGGAETMTFDLTLCDETGEVRVEIEGFTLRRIDGQVLERALARQEKAAGERMGLNRDEALEAFSRLLCTGLPTAGISQVAVSPRDLPAAIARGAAAAPRPEEAAELGVLAGAAAHHPRPAIETPYAAPRSAAERQLAAIWESRLGIDRVGIHDNFFELGGDSVLAIQVLAAGHEQGFDLRPAHLFEHPTVAGLAALAAARRPAEPDAAAAGPPTPEPAAADRAAAEPFPLARLSAAELAGIQSRFKR